MSLWSSVPPCTTSLLLPLRFLPLGKWQRTLQSSGSPDQSPPKSNHELQGETKAGDVSEGAVSELTANQAAVVAPGVESVAEVVVEAVAEPAIKVEVGVGPHPQPWPEGERFDPELLERGDRRNVVDAYRYWSREAIVADLDTRRHPFHVAIENWEHDFNIGTVVRNANAFLASAVHIVGKRRWNRRGAMVTDRYQHVLHHPDFVTFAEWAANEGLPIIGIDNIAGSVPIESTPLPQNSILLFGQEGPGLTQEAQKVVEMTCAITQYLSLIHI